MLTSSTPNGRFQGPQPPPQAIGVFSFFDEPEHFIKHIKVPKISDLVFEVDGIPLNAANQSEQEEDKLILWATLGYLPFSITSYERRMALIRIVEASHVLPHVKIGVSVDMRIVVTASYKIETPPSPNYIFEPVIRFIQEARPFIRLIGEYL
ncbi:MAG: hypothetical protein AB7E52_06955 [Bdellovibrionales bacterium]